jgi:hypothetical protein
MRMRRLLVFCAALALSVGAATAGAGGGGNSANAKMCEKNGWQALYRTDGSSFANQGACVSYGARGGTLKTTRAVITSVFGILDIPSPTQRYFGVTGTGFLPNHAITVTVTGPVEDDLGGAPLSTDGTGAFTTGSGLNTHTFFLYHSCNAASVHVVATDGTNTASTDATLPACST